MPTAETILHASKAAITAARGSGNAGLNVIAHLGPQTRALVNLIAADAVAKL